MRGANPEALVHSAMDMGIAFQRECEKILARTCGYGVIQVKIVLFVAKKGDSVLQKELEPVFNLSRPAITQLVDTMTANGLLYREMVEGDKRLKKVCLTDSGKSLARRSGLELAKFYKLVGEALDTQDMKNLSLIVKKLRKKLEINSDQTAF